MQIWRQAVICDSSKSDRRLVCRRRSEEGGMKMDEGVETEHKELCVVFDLL